MNRNVQRRLGGSDGTAHNDVTTKIARSPTYSTTYKDKIRKKRFGVKQ